MWTPSARRYPSFREPSCRWNIGSLSRKSTLRSLAMPLSPAFKDSIRWLTAAVLFRGQTLQMVTVVALALAHSTKSLYWAVMPDTSRSSLSVSQSFPPPMRMMREKGLSIGRLSRASCRSLITPPRLQMHCVATSLSSDPNYAGTDNYSTMGGFRIQLTPVIIAGLAAEVTDALP